MKILFLNQKNKDFLDKLNISSGDPTQQLSPVAYVNGYFLNQDLLTDCGSGQTWEYYGKFLNKLDVIDVDIEILIPKVDEIK